MPKEVWKIDRFDGGQDNASDARDIQDKSLVIATDVEIGTAGQLKMQGSAPNTSQVGKDAVGASAVGLFTPGMGTLYWQSDYKWAPITGGMHGIASVDSGYMGHIPRDNGHVSFINDSCDYNNGTTITHDADSRIGVGMFVTQADGDIPANTYITSITDSTHFVISASTINGPHTDSPITFSIGSMFTTAQLTNVFRTDGSLSVTNVAGFPGYKGKDTLTFSVDPSTTSPPETWDLAVGVASGRGFYRAYADAVNCWDVNLNFGSTAGDTALGDVIFQNGGVTTMELSGSTDSQLMTCGIHLSCIEGKRYNVNVRIADFYQNVPVVSLWSTALASAATEQTQWNNYFDPRDHVDISQDEELKIIGDHDSCLPDDFIPNEVASGKFSAMFLLLGHGEAHSSAAASWSMWDNIEVYEVDPQWSDTDHYTTIKCHKRSASSIDPGVTTSSNMFRANELVGAIIRNVTDGSYSTVLSNTTNEISMGTTQRIVAIADDVGTDSADRTTLTTKVKHGLVNHQRVYITGLASASTNIPDGNYNVYHTGNPKKGPPSDKESKTFDIDIAFSSASTGLEGSVTAGLVFGFDNGWQCRDTYCIGDTESNKAISTYAINNVESSGGNYMWWKESPLDAPYRWNTAGGVFDMGSSHPIYTDYYLPDGNVRSLDASFNNNALWYGYIKESRFTALPKFFRDQPGAKWGSEYQHAIVPQYGAYVATESSTYRFMRGVLDPSGAPSYPKHRAQIEAINTGALWYDDIDGQDMYVMLLDAVDENIMRVGAKFQIIDWHSDHNSATNTYYIIDRVSIANDYIYFRNTTGIASRTHTAANSFVMETEALPQIDQTPGVGMSIQSKENSASVNVGTWMGYAAYYSTWIYDGYQESLPVRMKNKLSSNSHGIDLLANDLGQTKRYRFYVKPGKWYKYAEGEGYGDTPYSLLNSRITGARIYWRAADAHLDEKGDMFLLADLDFRAGKGARKSPTVDAWVDWQEYDPANIDYHYKNAYATNDITRKSSSTDSTDVKESYVQAAEWIEHIGPPKSHTYSAMSGMSADELGSHCRAKTGCVVKNKVYLGNIEYYVKSDAISYDTPVKNATGMMVSLPFKPDVFPVSGIENLASEFGDEIIKLITYADRVLQFRKNSMHIINVTGDVNFVEESHRHKGITHPSAVCITDFGAAWVNNMGVYLYDGKTVRNLFEVKGIKMMSNEGKYDNNEGLKFGDIDSYSCDTTTVTINTHAAHGLKNGDKVSISETTDHDDDELASQVITVTDSDSFTMQRVGSDSASGTDGKWTTVKSVIGWDDFYTPNSIIAYIAEKRKLLVVRSCEPTATHMSEFLSSAQEDAMEDSLREDNYNFWSFHTGTTTLIKQDGFTVTTACTFANSSAQGVLSNTGAAKGEVYLNFETEIGEQYDFEVDVKAYTNSGALDACLSNTPSFPGGTITDASCSGTTITYTCTAHGLIDGDEVSISGTTNFNDDNLESQVVDRTNANAFKMTRSSSSSATGESGVFERMEGAMFGVQDEGNNWTLNSPFTAKSTTSYLVLRMGTTNASATLTIDQCGIFGVNSKYPGDCYLYDMVLQGWTHHKNFFDDEYIDSYTHNLNANNRCANFVYDENGNTLLPHDVRSGGHHWKKVEIDTQKDSEHYQVRTKDIDFGEPSIRKKIYKVYITYKCSGGTYPKIIYYTDGDNVTEKAFTAVTDFNNTGESWKQAIFKPATSSEANSIYSFQVELRRLGAGGDIDKSFAINDISIVYRNKQIK